MMYVAKQMLCALAIGLSVSACQLMLPKAEGLATTSWTAQSYERQDQVEVQWKQHGFSFLLYQQQQGNVLELVALSLTGQQLFKVTFDGQKVNVLQRIDAMKLLPFDYLVRDILFATYPHFIQLQAAHSQFSVQTEMQNFVQTNTVQIKQKNQQAPIFIIRYLQDRIELDNVQVPYQMVLSKIPNTLESNE